MRCRSEIRSTSSANFPFSILVIVNDLFFGMVCGLEDGSRLDIHAFRLESDPVLCNCFVSVPV